MACRKPKFTTTCSLSKRSPLGYNVFYHGQKGHYGVALLTKETPIAVRRGFPDDGEEAQRRIIMAEIPSPFGNVTVINGYFPQGESRDHETKFPAKAAFYQNLQNYLETELNKENPVLIMGDMNISPTDLDIGIGEENRKRWLRTGKCSFLPEEREWMDRLLGWGRGYRRQANPDNHEHFRGLITAPKASTIIVGCASICCWPASLWRSAAWKPIDYEIRGMENRPTTRRCGPPSGHNSRPSLASRCAGQNFLSKINKATVNHCDGRRNRILSRALLMSTASRLYRSTSHAKEAVIRPLVKGWDFALVATLAVISHRVGLHDLLTHLHLLQDTLRHQGAGDIWSMLRCLSLPPCV